MDSQTVIIKEFKVELNEIKEECNISNNLNRTSAQLILLLNKYASKTKSLTQDEQQEVWRKIYKMLTPGIFVLSEEWQEICNSGCAYLLKFLG